MKLYISSIIFVGFTVSSIVDLEYFNKFYRFKGSSIDFDFENFQDQIRIKDENVCWTILENKLVFNECSNSPNQLFQQNESGQISLINDTGKCLNLKFADSEMTYDDCSVDRQEGRSGEYAPRYDITTRYYGYYYDGVWYNSKKARKDAIKKEKKEAKAKLKAQKKKIKSATKLLNKTLKKCKNDLSTPECKDPLLEQFENAYREPMTNEKRCRWGDFTILGAYRCYRGDFCYRKEGWSSWSIGACKSCQYISSTYPFITCKELYPIGEYADTKRTAEECINSCYKSIMNEADRKKLVKELYE